MSVLRSCCRPWKLSLCFEFSLFAGSVLLLSVCVQTSKNPRRVERPGVLVWLRGQDLNL